MTATRTLLAFTAAATIGSGLAWSPLASAQSTGTTISPSPTAPAPAPATPAPSATPPKAASSAPARSTAGKSDAQLEARITQLHRELKITSAQESQWNAVAQDMRDSAQKMSSLMQRRGADAKAKHMSAVDNLKSYEAIADAHVDGLKKITPDFEKLYDSMSAAQKKTADNLFNQRINERVRTTASPSGKQG